MICFYDIHVMYDYDFYFELSIESCSPSSLRSPNYGLATATPMLNSISYFDRLHKDSRQGTRLDQRSTPIFATFSCFLIFTPALHHFSIQDRKTIILQRVRTSQ